MKGMYELEQKQFIQSVSKGIPLGRVGTAGELGNAVVFLASDQSSYIIGINLTVDGGQVQVYAENIWYISRNSFEDLLSSKFRRSWVARNIGFPEPAVLVHK